MKISNLYLVFFFLFPVFSYGQIDTAYIQELSDSKTLAVHSDIKNFKISFGSSVSETLAFQNSSLGLGAQFRFKKIGISLSFPIASLNQSAFGQHRALGFDFDLQPSSYYIQGNFHYISGFNDLRAIGTELREIFRGDNRMVHSNLIVSYVFNAQKYSLRSAIKMVDRQKQSAGSWLVSLPLNFQHFTTDSLNVPLDQDPDFTLNLNRNFQGGLGGGYSYTKVFNHWSATLLATGGVEFKGHTYRQANDGNYRSQFLVSPWIRLMGSLIYNSPQLFYGFVTHFVPGIEGAQGLKTRTDNLRIRLVVGFRFD